MSEIHVFYYDKDGVRRVTDLEHLHMPANIYRGVIDNLNETLQFVSINALNSDASQEELQSVCECAIKPYSEAIRKYGYEFFIKEVSFLKEKYNILCMLREI